MAINEKRHQSRRGRNSRAKGKKAQKAVKAILTESLGLSEDDLFSAVGGSKEDDIRGSAAFKEKFGFRIEVKNERVLRMAAYIEQAELDSSAFIRKQRQKEPWVLLFKLHGKSKFYATLEFTELMKLLNHEKSGEEDEDQNENDS